MFEVAEIPDPVRHIAGEGAVKLIDGYLDRGHTPADKSEHLKLGAQGIFKLRSGVTGIRDGGGAS